MLPFEWIQQRQNRLDTRRQRAAVNNTSIPNVLPVVWGKGGGQLNGETETATKVSDASEIMSD